MGVQNAYAENEIYAVLNETDSIMTLRYDDQRVANSGVTNWSDWKAKVKTCVLDESMQAARPDSTREWFVNFSKLLEIQHLDYLNTEDVTTMRSMFYGCSRLASLDVSHFDTKNVNTMRTMFNGCSRLASLDVSHFDTKKVNTMRSMFNGCSRLASLDVSRFNTANVTDMSYMFYRCSSLTSLDVSSFNTAKVTDMSYMFSDCYVLTSLDVSNFNTKNVTTTHGMFSGCKALTTLDLSNFNTEKVTDMSFMFNACIALTSLNLSSFNTEKVTNMSYMFSACSALTSLNLCNFNISKLENTLQMFRQCSLLQTIYCNDNWSASETLTSSSGMFESCTSLVGGKGTHFTPGWEIDKTYARPDEGTAKPGYFTLKVKEIYAALNSVGDSMTIYYDCNKESRKRVLTDWTPAQGTYNMSDALRNAIKAAAIDATMADALPTSTEKWFSKLSNLLSINGLDKLNTSEVTNMHAMFASCTSLTSLDLSSFNTANVTQMSNMFEICSSLTSLNLTGFNTEKVTEMRSMFNKCSSLTSLDLSSFNTANVTSMWNMFSDCTSLATLTLGNFNNAKVQDMAYMFSNCNALTALDMSNFNTANVIYMSDMFYKCYTLTSLDLSSFKTENVTDMRNMFNGCAGLTSINLSSFNTAKVEYMNCMFMGCTALTSLDLNNFNIDKVTTMSQMFFGCSNLKTILCINDWSESTVSTDSGNMFYGCTALVGEKGTTYNESNITAAYAHPDEGTSNPGYFSTKICYIITWKMDDGTVIDQTSVEAGVVPTHDDPTKPATAQYSYTFAGWTPEVVAATEDATYTATFTSSVNTYDITFELKDDASKSYKVEDVPYGTTLGQLIDQVKAAFGGETYEDDQYIYTFAGIENAQMTDIITESKTYYVLYTKEAKPTTGLDQVNSQELKAKSQKLIRDGQIFILRNGKTFTVTGQEVK